MEDASCFQEGAEPEPTTAGQLSYGDTAASMKGHRGAASRVEHQAEGRHCPVTSRPPDQRPTLPRGFTMSRPSGTCHRTMLL